MSTENSHPDRAEGGFVPRLGADPSAASYELITATQAVDRVAAVGFDRADAQQMVEQYLAPSRAVFGPGPGDGWRVDPYDLTEIARAYDWVDHYRGETIADARARAAQYAVDYQRKAATVDRERDPGYAARLDRDAVEWADRARDGHNPWPAPEPRLATTDDTYGELTEDEERAEVEAVTNALDEDQDEDEPRTAEQQARSALVVSASWALAARDIAIERGDTEHATRFTHNAREAITAAEAAGITREQLAAELDYPGGAAELDGEHIEVGIESGRPHTAAQLAVLDAAWNEAMGLTPTATPPQHPDDIRGPIQAGRGDGETAEQPEVAGPEVVGLVCPECEQDVVEQAPTTLAPYEAHGMEHPDYSHMDGEPLCPVIGPRGYQPAEPVEIHAAATRQEAHRTHDGDSDAQGDSDRDGDSEEDDDGGVRGPDDGPRPIPLGGSNAAPRDDATQDGADANGDPGATNARTGDQPGRERDEAGAGRDDPAAVAWWAPTAADAVALSHREVEQELTGRGLTPDQARAAISDYLDQTSEQVGESVHQWGLDSHDVEAIAHTHRAEAVIEVPEQRRLATRSEQHQVAAGVEDDRRDQLIRWHTDDRTGAHGDEHGQDGLVRALDDYAPAGATTSQDW